MTRASGRAPRIASVATALPPHQVRQEDAREFVAALFSELAAEEPRLLAIFDHAGIEKRHTCMPVAWYAEPHTFGETNDVYIERALELASEAAGRALSRAGLSPADVDHVLMVSSTGLATPSLDARLANRMGFRGDILRTPVWGLGCAGGAAGLARARDFALARPRSRVLLVALELCSLAFQHRDSTRQNLVAASLFGDGAAAAIVAGPEVEPRAEESLAILATRSTLWPDTLDVMGWGVDEHGLHVIFSRDIPSIVRDRVRPALEEFLASQGLDLERLDHLVAHPGGPRVLAAYAEALGLAPQSLRHARDVLRSCGNMSSPTCLFVLERFLEGGEFSPGQSAVVAALGPGFCSELVLLECRS